MLWSNASTTVDMCFNGCETHMPMWPIATFSDAPAQAGPFLAPTEEDRAESRRRRPRFTLGDAAVLAEALLVALGQETPQRQPAGFPCAPPAMQQPPPGPPLLAPPNPAAQPVQAAALGDPVASQGAQPVPTPRLLLPAPDAAVHSLPAGLPPAWQQHLPGQGPLPLPSMNGQPGLAAMPRPSARPPAVQPLPGQPLPWPPGAAFLPSHTASPAVPQPGPVPPPPRGTPPAALGSLPVPVSMPGAYAGSVPWQQPPQEHLARPAPLAGAVVPAADAGARPHGHGAGLSDPTSAAATATGDPLAAPPTGSYEQQQDAAVPVPMDTDAATDAPPAPVVSEATAPQQQVTGASGEQAGSTVIAPSEPPAAPAIVLSEGRAAVLDALDRALGIMPPSAAGDGSLSGTQSATPQFATPAWLPSPLPSAVPVMGALGPPFSVMHPSGRALPFQMPAGAGPPGSVPAAVGGVRGPTLDRGAAMDEEVRRLRSDMAARARVQEERERRLVEVQRRSTAWS